MKILTQLLCVFSLLGPIKQAWGSASAPAAPKDVTVLIYYSGDNRLSEFMHSSYLRVLREGAGPSVNVLIQYDGAEKNDSFRVAIGDKKVGNDYEQTFYAKNIEYDMGNEKTLVDFVVWGKKHFPAKRTMLVISSHGFGILNNPFPLSEKKKTRPNIAKLASSIDEGSHSFIIEENLKNQLSKALGNQKLDLLIHNSCLMGSLESLSILSSVAKYAIASEYSIYMNKQDDLIDDQARTILIEKVIAQIKANPSVTELEIGKKVIHDFGVNYKDFQAPATDSDEPIRFPSTLAFYDLNLISGLASKYSKLTKEFIQKANNSPEIFARFFDENLKARYVDSFGYLDVRVLYKSLITALYPNDVKAKMDDFDNLMNKVVPEKVGLYTSQPEPIAHLHVFFPAITTQGDITPYQKSYTSIKTVRDYGWPNFLNFFWKGMEKYQNPYWISKLKAWDNGETVIVKTNSNPTDYDDDLFLQMDMMVIRLLNNPNQDELKNYANFLTTLKRSSPILEKHRTFVTSQIK